MIIAALRLYRHLVITELRTVAPPSDHLHTKRTQQRKLIGEKTFIKSWGGGVAPVAPSGYATVPASINLLRLGSYTVS